MSAHGQAKTLMCNFHGWVYPWHECKAVEMTPEDEAAAIAALEAVTAATPAVLVYPTGSPNAHSGWYCGTWEWRTHSGWVVRVYNDCAEWDYLESITAPDGRSWAFPFGHDGPVMTDRLKDWKPTDESGWPGIEHCGP